MLLKVSNIYTGYERDSPLIQNFSFDFEEKIYAILGPSGCGKTTFLKTIAGLIKPLSGEIMLDDVNIYPAYKNKIYMMHQNYTSFDWLNCLDNILIAKKIVSHVSSEDINNAKNLLNKVGLNGYEKCYPKQLSGGQKQRLALARTLFTNPSVILMDEPLSALDEETRRTMQDLIIESQQKNHNIIILVTHSKSEAEYMSDNIISFRRSNGII